jgi:hypothetical protein
LLLNSHRSGGVDADIAMTYSFWPWRLITVVAPGFFGTPGRGTYWGYGAHWEDVLYIGVLPLLLAGAAAVVTARRAGGTSSPAASGSTDDRGRSGSADLPSRLGDYHQGLTRFWLVSALTALVLALGKNTSVFPFLFRRIPGFDLFQAPTRWLAVTTVALSLASGIGLQRCVRTSTRPRAGLLILTIGGALLLAGLAAPRLVEGVPPTFGPATARLGVALALSGGLALVRVWIPRTGAGARAAWQLAVLTFVALDLLTVGRPLVPSVDRVLYEGKTGASHVLHGASAHPRVYWPADPDHHRTAYDALYRVKFDYLSFDDFGPSEVDHWWGMREDQIPNAAMLDKVASANNFDPLLVDWYADVLEAAINRPDLVRAMGATHVTSDGPWPWGEQVHRANYTDFYQMPDLAQRAWIVHQARYVSTSSTLDELSSQSFDPTEVVLIAGVPLGQTQTGGSRTSAAEPVLRDGANRVTIRAVLDAPGYLVVADTWYPGWHARVDGEPAQLLRANHAFRAVQLTAGEHIVEMFYRPTSVLVGAAASVLALGLFLFGILICRRN